MKLRWNWNRWPIALGVILFAGANALAHEKWFVDEYAIPPGPPVFLRVDPLFAIVTIAAAVAVFLAAVWIDRKLDGSQLTRWIDARMIKARISPHAVLGALLGASFMGAGLQHTLFSPNLSLPATLWGTLIQYAETILGTLMLFLEPFYPEFGVAIILLFLAGLSVEPFWDQLEELIVVGAAIFFICNETIREPWRKWNTPERRRLGYQAFRIFVGLNFLILAMVKWLRPELAMAVVAQYHINFMAWMHYSDIQFVFCAAIIETLISLCILLRIAYRPALMMAFIVFTLSIFFLGFRELLGHLPIKATIFMFFVYGHWHKGEQKP